MEKFFNKDVDRISAQVSGTIRGDVAVAQFKPKLDEFSKNFEACAGTKPNSKLNEEVKKMVATHMENQIDWLVGENKKIDGKNKVTKVNSEKSTKKKRGFCSSDSD